MLTLCWRPRDYAPSEADQIEDFRYKTIAYTGSWPTFWSAYAQNVLSTFDCSAALVSILGASHNGSTLMVLGSWGPDAAATYTGRLLPSPWRRPVTAAPDSKPAKQSRSKASLRRPNAPADVPAALTWKSGAELSLPYEWHQLLGQTRFAEALCLHASLEPLLLGGRLVGALLLVRYAGEALPAAAVGSLDRGGARPGEAPPAFAPDGLPVASAPFNCPSTWTGGGEARGAGGEGGGNSAAAAKSFLCRIMRKRPPELDDRRAASAPSPALLRGLARALSQAAFGPHLRVVSRVCTACQTLASASSLFGLASVLSVTISEALAAELHVNLAIRIAVVPPLHGQYGYLLPLDTAALGGWEQGLGFPRIDSPVKRAASGVVLSATATTSARALRTRGRTGSFSGQAPASGPNSIPSAPGGGALRGEPAREVAAFPLPSSLLLHLLRSYGRAGYGSVNAGGFFGGGGGGNNISQLLADADASYHPEEPTVRGLICEVATEPLGGKAGVLPSPPAVRARLPRDAPKSSAAVGGAPSAREPALVMQRSGISVNSVPGGVGGVGGMPTSFVSGMVVANLNAWVQDVERPSSDVALLLLAARGRGAAAALGAGPGRPSQGGAGGGGPALGGGPACLVAVVGSLPSRSGAMAAAAAAVAVSGSANSVVKSGNLGDDPWFRSLDASQRRGAVAADTSLHPGGPGYGYGGGAYGGGSVRYDSAGAGSYGPCVALYMTAQERLPASLLSAVKDRAQALLELLLPACLGSLKMGPVRAELDLLAPGGGGASAAASTGAGAAASVRRLMAAANGSVGSGASASATPLPSIQVSGSHVQLSQLQLQSQNQPSWAGHGSIGGAGSPRRGGPALGSGIDDAASAPPPALRSPLRHTGGSGPITSAVASVAATAGGGVLSSSGSLSPVLPAAAAAAQRSAGSGGGKVTREDGGGGGSGRASNQQFALGTESSKDLCLTAQQRWPDGVLAPNISLMHPGNGTAAAGGGSITAIATSNGTAAVPTTAPPSSTSRTTRGSPGSCGFGAMAGGIGGDELGGAGGGLAASRGTSLDVTGAMEDMVSSMRDNLDVWVNSFWEMLRESPAKGGHMHGSYADDDLRFLRLYQRLGSGGAASVYAGVLLGMDVAVKVIDPPPEVDMEALVAAWPGPGPGLSPQGPASPAEGFGGSPPAGGSGCESEAEGERLANLATVVRQAQMRELVRSARECAVLTTLSHPAIVQVYSYHTRVHVVPGDGPEALPRLVPVPPGEGGEVAQGPLHSVLIMERCDLGSLADALDNGMFKKAIIAAATAAPSGPPGAAGAAAGPARSGGTAGRTLAPSTQADAAGSGGGGGFTFSSGSSRAVSTSTGLVSAGGGGGGGLSAMRAIYLTLLELALALRHLHSLNLVHCDIKVANVLLKSSASDPRGFTCKLSDFGLVNLLRADEEGEQELEDEEGDEGREHGGAGAEGQQGAQEGGRRGPAAAGQAAGTGLARLEEAAVPVAGRGPWMRNADAAGTVTHLAPECFEQGRRLDQSVDIYAFGIVMWEVFTRKPPYAEFAPDFEGLSTRVLEGLRPRFPSHCPAAYRALAQACWCRNPLRRPTAATIVNCLQQMLEGGPLPLPQQH